jgi:hypothetical protein
MSEDMEMIPEMMFTTKKLKGRQGNFQIIINNKGNSANTYQLNASDPDGQCEYSFSKQIVILDAVATTTVNLTVKFRNTSLIGASKICDFTVTANKTKQEVTTARGQLERPSRLPIWALLACGIINNTQFERKMTVCMIYARMSLPEGRWFKSNPRYQL